MSGFVPFADLSPEQATRLREIYVGAFPDDLAAPFEDLLADRMLAYLDAEEVVGLALLRDLADPAGGLDTGWTFLRYFAAGPRGGGVGSRMFGALRALLADEQRRLLVWDVEDPEAPGVGREEAALDRRRIGFYERNGGVLLPVVQYRPPHDDGHAPSLRLMAAPLGGSALPAARAVLLAAMRWRYGCGPEHPAVRQSLEASGF